MPCSFSKDLYAKDLYVFCRSKNLTRNIFGYQLQALNEHNADYFYIVCIFEI